jgi:hypothetical protein
LKFKSLFVSFNIVLFLSFVTVFFLPFFIMDRGFMLEFWSKNWYFTLIFAVILLVINGIFFSYWKMLTFLENEDWPGLSQYLETAVFDKKQYGKRQVSLLCDSLLLLRDFASLSKLEKILRKERPRLFACLGMRFAAGALLAGKFDDLKPLAVSLSGDKNADTDWLEFYAAFSRHLLKKYEEAATHLMPLAVTARDPLVAALSGYVCGSLLRPRLESMGADIFNASQEAKKRITGKFTREKWKAFVEEEKASMHVVVLGKMIEETETWLFG